MKHSVLLIKKEKVSVATLAVIVELSLLIISLLWILIRKLPVLKDIHVTPSAITMGLIVGAILLAASGLFTIIDRKFFANRTKYTLETHFYPLFKELTFPQILIIALLSGVCEEIFFRGVLLAEFGIIVSSAIFGILHTPNRKTWFLGFWTALIGAILALAYKSTGNIFIPMVAHFANNLIAITAVRYFMDLPEVTEEEPEETSEAGAVDRTKNRRRNLARRKMEEEEMSWDIFPPEPNDLTGTEEHEETGKDEKPAPVEPENLDETWDTGPAGSREPYPEYSPPEENIEAPSKSEAEPSKMDRTISRLKKEAEDVLHFHVKDEISKAKEGLHGIIEEMRSIAEGFEEGFRGTDRKKKGKKTVEWSEIGGSTRNTEDEEEQRTEVEEKSLGTKEEPVEPPKTASPVKLLDPSMMTEPDYEPLDKTLETGAEPTSGGPVGDDDSGVEDFNEEFEDPEVSTPEEKIRENRPGQRASKKSRGMRKNRRDIRKRPESGE